MAKAVKSLRILNYYNCIWREYSQRATEILQIRFNYTHQKCAWCESTQIVSLSRLYTTGPIRERKTTENNWWAWLGFLCFKRSLSCLGYVQGINNDNNKIQKKYCLSLEIWNWNRITDSMNANKLAPPDHSQSHVPCLRINPIHGKWTSVYSLENRETFAGHFELIEQFANRKMGMKMKKKTRISRWSIYFPQPSLTLTAWNVQTASGNINTVNWQISEKCKHRIHSIN